MQKAISYGCARGLFSNESGMGSAPIVAAAAATRNPARQALVSMTGTFWDTVIICALTGLVLVFTMIAHPDIITSGTITEGAELSSAAFASIPYVGKPGRADDSAAFCRRSRFRAAPGRFAPVTLHPRIASACFIPASPRRGGDLAPLCARFAPDRPFGLGYATSGTSLNAMVYWLISGAVWLKNTYPVTGARRVSRT